MANLPNHLDTKQLFAQVSDFGNKITALGTLKVLKVIFDIDYVYFSRLASGLMCFKHGLKLLRCTFFPGSQLLSISSSG